jgi:hypothetical protein
MSDQIMKPQRRVIQYQYADGMYEIDTGLDYLILTAFLYATSFLNPNYHSRILELFFLGVCLLIYIGGQMLIDLLIRKMKDHFIYPRSGYVSYPKKADRSWQENMLGVIIFVAVIMVGVVFLSKFPGAAKWLPALTGLIIALRLSISTFRARLVRFYILGAISIIMGIVMSLGPIDREQGFIFCLALISLIFIISGSITLWTYLHQTRPPEADTSAD